MSTGEPPRHDPPYPTGKDDRPWWYIEDRAAQKELNAEFKAELKELRRAVSDGFDRVADELATTRGAATGKKATIGGLVIIVTTATAVVGVVAAIVIPLVQ